MNGQDFLRIAHEAYVPFLTKLGFVMGAPTISGRFYRVDFSSPSNAVSVSYEPGDDALFVVVFTRVNGQLSDIDDRSKTPHLPDLNGRFIQMTTASERAANEAAFESIAVHDNQEHRLLKAAKELRLVLPPFIASQNSGD